MNDFNFEYQSVYLASYFHALMINALIETINISLRDMKQKLLLIFLEII